MPNEVSVFVANRNGLPFLKLMQYQLQRFSAGVSFDLLVWDNASTDGSSQWLKRNSIQHFDSPQPKTHSQSLLALIEKTTSTYICFMDVDAFPVKDGWLEEAVRSLDAKTLIVGHSAFTGWRLFVHPCFLVVRRSDYERLKLSPSEIHDGPWYYDVGSKMTEIVEDAGFFVRFVGCANFHPDHMKKWYQKVCHLHGATAVLNKIGHKESDVVKQVEEHKKKLRWFEIWEQFQKFVKESLPTNPNCARYF